MKMKKIFRSELNFSEYLTDQGSGQHFIPMMW